MKFLQKHLARFAFLALFLAVNGIAKAEISNSGSEELPYVPGEVIVRLDQTAGQNQNSLLSTMESLGALEMESVGSLVKGLRKITLREGASVESAVEKLSQTPGVRYAQPNYILSILPMQSREPAPRKRCWIPGIDFPRGCLSRDSSRPPLADAPAVGPRAPDSELNQLYGLAKISASQAWKTSEGSNKIVVAVVDTGIDYNHPDMSRNVWRGKDAAGNTIAGYNFVHDDYLPYSDDDVTHGAHCAGTIGAVGDNGRGITGVVKTATVMGVKGLSGSGSGTIAALSKSIDWAVKNGAKIINASWGGRGSQPAIEETIRAAGRQGVLFVAAAGNSSADNDKADFFPANSNADNVISVAATDSNDQLASFSNFGAKKVHLAAPGVKILSISGGTSGYRSLSGTSMAAPHVSGAAALVWSAHPEWDYKMVKRALLETVDVLPNLAGKTITGGRLNVAKAVQFKP